jgi:hypothetical protein
MYENLNKGDKQAVRDAISTQHEYEKKVAPTKAAAAASALSIPVGMGTAKAVDTALNAHR